MQEVLKIEKIRRTCAHCGKEFAYGQEVVSAVVSADDRLARTDYCAGCWASNPAEAYSYWRGIFPEKSKPNIEDMDKVQRFFDKLAEKPDPTPEILGVRFFTALVLARRKRVKLLGSRTAGDRTFLRIEKAWDGERIELEDPGITEEKLEEIRRNMEALFEMELSGN